MRTENKFEEQWRWFTALVKEGTFTAADKKLARLFYTKGQLDVAQLVIDATRAEPSETARLGV